MSENPFQALCQTFDKISKSIQTQLSQFISFNDQQSPSSNQPHLLVAVSSSSKASSLSNPNVDPTLLQPTDAHVKRDLTLSWYGIGFRTTAAKSWYGIGFRTTAATLSCSAPANEIQTTTCKERATQRKNNNHILSNSVAAPVTKEELGRATWTFLHTLAAQYPDRPTRQQKKDVKELVAILSRMYPCKECADHFKEVLRANPVQADSQAELSRWFCHVHNVVNRSLDKPRFPCERVDARWGKLDCEQRACDLQGDTSIFGNLKY